MSTSSADQCPDRPTDDEREAMEWLADFRARYPHHAHGSTIQRMLAQPRLPMPAELTDSMVEAIWGASSGGATHRDLARNVVTAMHAELAKPETQEGDVWRVESFNVRNGVPCITITGPHKQRVPT